MDDTVNIEPITRNAVYDALTKVCDAQETINSDWLGFREARDLRLAYSYLDLARTHLLEFVEPLKAVTNEEELQ